MMSFKFYVKILCYFYLISSASSARILGIFTMNGRSHFNFHETIVQNLLAAGHHVTVVAPFASQISHENYTIINSRVEEDKSLQPLSSVALPSVPWFLMNLHLLDLLQQDCHNVVSLEQIKALKNVDLMFVETMPMYQCYLPIAKKLNVPVIGTFSGRSLIQSDDSIGNPRFPSVYPTELFLSTIRMTFLQRVLNFMREFEIRVAYFLEKRRIDKFYTDHFPNQEPHGVRLSLLFVNDHSSFMSRTTAPNSINIGGINIKSYSLQPIAEELKKFIEGAKHGVILFSLGSIVTEDAIDSDVVTALRNAFAKIPQRVIWKFDGHIEGLSENVLLRKWIPQKEILAHVNVLAFISHCGLGSTYEAIYFGKPMILMPVYADQPGNAGVLSSLDVGLLVDFMDLSEMKLLDAIDRVINETKYRDNMANLSKRFKDELISPGKLVVFWTEYVLRHKGAFHLRTVEADMPLHQFLLFDVIVFLLFTVTLSGYLICCLIKRIMFMRLSKLYKKYIRDFSLRKKNA